MFLSQNIFRDSKKIFCDFEFSVGMKLENEKTESVNENQNKEFKMLMSFKNTFCKKNRQALIKVKTQSDMKE